MMILIWSEYLFVKLPNGLAFGCKRSPYLFHRSLFDVQSHDVSNKNANILIPLVGGGKEPTDVPVHSKYLLKGTKMLHIDHCFRYYECRKFIHD